MDVSVLQHQLDTITVNKRTKEGILTVIDLKVNSEMKEVIMKIDNMEKRFDQRFEAIGQRFDEIEKRFSSQFSMLKWMIGILAAMMSAVMTTLLLKS